MAVFVRRVAAWCLVLLAGGFVMLACTSGEEAAEQPTPSPVPQAASTPTGTPTSTATPTATATSTATATPTATATATATPTSTVTPTPTPTLAPPVPVDRELELVVGESGRILVATDTDGEVASVRLSDAPEGAFVSPAGQLSWRPESAGRFPVQVTVTDNDGLTWEGDLVLRSTWPARDQAMISLGDSVPSGHGLDLDDYLELDPCWRSDDAYPNRVYAALQSVGILDPATSEFAQVSCSGYFTRHLWTRLVTGGFPHAGDEPDQRRTQLDWAIRANAQFVTLTIGANDTGFVGPERLFTEDLELDLDQVDTRLGNIESGLTFILQELIDATDSTIFVTNYYNPTAANPQGIDGCRTACFAEKSGFVVAGMNDVIASVATSFGDRVVFVPVDEQFAGHGAPNGLGPDGFREAGFGVVGDLLNIQVAEIHPYCARGEARGESWINRIDCVHPNDAGTEAMARAVAAAIVGHNS